eukprot:CAMPEP_0203006078 /NCGR_PEP_ID=MMETSP1401-20130829/3981_1 /ASSEMBLY_ACC=CAM_ASM_000894 /TAXON_ID=38833 /ORGANISM="Micromonas pusilla, Strain CCAC1681" /LENGTH=106 /DNA_ID=CAMNT_0049747709 /DNA_START=28 /DNA_END=348 /DNA_ORIENTATION=+
MAPAKVTDAFQATKRGRGVAKGKPKAKSVRAADTKPENDTTEEYLNILKSFDMTSKFGPALGLTRLERWERAEKLDLSPPADVLRILREVGEDDPEIRECVWERIV